MSENNKLNEMNKGIFNWKAMIIGFMVTLILLPFLEFIAPLIGGIIAGYLVDGKYKNGIYNGGISASIASLLYALVTFTHLSGSDIAKAASMNLSVGTFTILSIILATIGGLLLGLIGGIIGVAIKKHLHKN